MELSFDCGFIKNTKGGAKLSLLKSKICWGFLPNRTNYSHLKKAEECTKVEKKYV